MRIITVTHDIGTVFTTHGKMGTDVLGEINWFKADCRRNTALGQGTGKVTLSNDLGHRVTLDLSFEQDETNDQWTFTLHNIDGVP